MQPGFRGLFYRPSVRAVAIQWTFSDLAEIAEDSRSILTGGGAGRINSAATPLNVSDVGPHWINGIDKQRGLTK